MFNEVILQIMNTKQTYIDKNRSKIFNNVETVLSL